MRKRFEEVVRKTTDAVQRGLDKINDKVEEIANRVALEDIVDGLQQEMDQICYEVGKAAIEKQLGAFAAEVVKYNELKEEKEECEAEIRMLAGEEEPTCPGCGRLVDEDERFCKECGTKLQ